MKNRDEHQRQNYHQHLAISNHHRRQIIFSWCISFSIIISIVQQKRSDKLVLDAITHFLSANDTSVSEFATTQIVLHEIDMH